MPRRDDSPPSQAALVSARILAADAVTAEVVAEFKHRGIRALLLKGASHATWLYDGEARPYGDADLLVSPGAFDVAEEILRSLGFELRDTGVEPPARGLPYARTWTRTADLVDVDLHRTLSGAGAAPEGVWAALSTRTETIPIHSVDVEVLGAPGRLLLVVLHAWHHGPGRPKTAEDLRRAISRVSSATWHEAAALAERLDALPAFVGGLRLLPEGRELSQGLRLPSADLVEYATRPGSSTRVTLGIERLAQARGVRQKGRLLLREGLPDPSFLRWWSPLARRGRLGLLTAYVWRLVWLAWQAPASYRAWRRAASRR